MKKSKQTQSLKNLQMESMDFDKSEKNNHIKLDGNFSLFASSQENNHFNPSNKNKKNVSKHNIVVFDDVAARRAIVQNICKTSVNRKWKINKMQTKKKIKKAKKKKIIELICSHHIVRQCTEVTSIIILLFVFSIVIAQVLTFVDCQSFINSSTILKYDKHLPEPYKNSKQHSSATNSNVIDLIVNIGENTILECDTMAHSQFYRNLRKDRKLDPDSNVNNKIIFINFEHTLKQTKNRKKIQTGVNSNRFGQKLLRKANKFKYIWCRFKENLVQNTSVRKQPFLLYKTCFQGDSYFIVNENQISTVLYRCTKIRRDSEQVVGFKIWKLYIDKFVSTLQKRDTMAREMHKWISSTPRGPSVPIKSELLRSCQPPRCKPYATVLRAHCSMIEFNIRYPNTQYGYNQTHDHWDTINCAEQIDGYQLWLIGYGVVKKFLPGDQIIMDNLIAGKRYCFNGWAYNACGSGPVFTLEGVCAKNTADCQSASDEHCELDVDYSY